MKRGPIFPGAVSVAGAALITEGDGNAALYLATFERGPGVRVHRIPDRCTITVQASHPLPAHGNVHHWHGVRVTFQTAEARQVLHVNTVRLCRVLLEVLDAYARPLEIDRATVTAGQQQAGAA